VLGVLLVLETATYASLTVFALVAAAIGYAARDKGGFGDIAAVLSVIVALIAVVLALLTFATWMSLRRGNPAALPLTIVAHAVPAVGLLLLRSSRGTLLGLTLAWTVVAVLGIALAVVPQTRRWLARPAQQAST
jgi:hypothetical protein